MEINPIKQGLKTELIGELMQEYFEAATYSL